MKTALIITIIISSILLYFSDREKRQLKEQNLKYINKITLLENEKSSCNVALYKYEMANALFFERYRNCGVKLNHILEQVK
jgi:hypothetical protein